jgi:hypothetical protein
LPPPGSSIVLAFGVIAEADEFRIALFGDVDVVRRIGAAHVERPTGPGDFDKTEIGEKLLHHVEVGRTHPCERHIFYLDSRHVLPPWEIC